MEAVLLRNLKCLKCQNALRPFASRDNEHGHYSIDTEDRDLYCTDCDAFYLVCNQCSDPTLIDHEEINEDASVVLCQFLGYDDCDAGDEDCPVEFRGKRVCMSGKDIDINKICHNYEARNVSCVSFGDICGDTLEGRKKWITGPDGGFHHYWRCNKCQTVVEALDK